MVDEVAQNLGNLLKCKLVDFLLEVLVTEGILGMFYDLISKTGVNEIGKFSLPQNI
jgi:hypothetical protein